MSEIDMTPLLVQLYEEGRLSARYDYTKNQGEVELYVDDIHLASFPIAYTPSSDFTASVYIPGCDHRTPISINAPRES